MNALFDSCWRAAAYCLHPRLIGLSLLPLLLIGGLALALGYAFWGEATGAVRDALDAWELLAPFFHWMESVGLGAVKSMVGPLVVVFLATPVLVVLSLLAVALMLTPASVRLVAQRRFPALEKRRGGTFAGSVMLGGVTSLLAVTVLVVTLPLWLVPPLALVLPPLIWGWLTYRVMSYDVLAEHASREERRELLRRHRLSFMAIGLFTGYMGMAPSLVWALGAMSVILAPLLVPLAVWIYTLVFAFSSLWFSHHALAALEALRRERDGVNAVPQSQAPTPAHAGVGVLLPEKRPGSDAAFP